MYPSRRQCPPLPFTIANVQTTNPIPCHPPFILRHTSEHESKWHTNDNGHDKEICKEHNGPEGHCAIAPTSAWDAKPLTYFTILVPNAVRWLISRPNAIPTPAGVCTVDVLLHQKSDTGYHCNCNGYSVKERFNLGTNITIRSTEFDYCQVIKVQRAAVQERTYNNPVQLFG